MCEYVWDILRKLFQIDFSARLIIRSLEYARILKERSYSFIHKTFYEWSCLSDFVTCKGSLSQL